MATDYQLLVRNLLAFHDFSDRFVLAVGAGGGQLVEYGRVARRVLAVDSDPVAVEKLRLVVEQKGLAARFDVRCCDFAEVQTPADVVLFEFSLHEMRDPALVLEKGRSLAPSTVVLDHWPGSEWAWSVAEDEKIGRSWRAVHALPVRASARHDTVQRFATYEELHARVESQGEVAVERIRRFERARDIVIPMSYGLALL